MKVIGKLYLTGGDKDLPEFTSASDEERAKMVHYYSGDCDMSVYWTQVGTFEADIIIDPPEDLTKRAVATVDAQIVDLEQKYHMAMQELMARRANLLCLEAPKNV